MRGTSSLSKRNVLTVSKACGVLGRPAPTMHRSLVFIRAAQVTLDRIFNSTSESRVRRAGRLNCMQIWRNITRRLMLIILMLGVIQIAHPQQIKREIPEIARPLPLSAVRLTGGPLKRAQDLDAAYLLKLEPDRMLAYYRKRAGLEPKAPGYGGWDGDGRNLTGHIAGHYLSAVSRMYAATGDRRFKERADYIVNELKLVQDKNGDGYLSALANGKEQFAEVS